MKNITGKNLSINNQTLMLIIVGSVIMYLFFISKQFIGDDWLWLANAKKAFDNPEIFFQRPMYGYLRPLNMFIIFIWQNIFGENAYIFSLINILLHASNIWLLWKVLKKFGVSEKVCNLSALIFGFYYLNSSALLWISVGHDLWVTMLSLLFTLKMIDLIERPQILNFIIVFLIGIAATLIKESGFVTIGLFFLLLILKRKNPLSKEFRLYSIFIILIYLIYIIMYFITRTYADKKLVIGLETIMNLWYFIIYIIFPLSKRFAAIIPEGMLWAVKAIKITATLAAPLVLFYAFKKGGNALKYFILWSVMFISTIIIFDWNLGLFDLYPGKTASRFMYSVIPGFSVVISWLIINVIWARFKFLNKKSIMIIMVILFISGNFLIIKKVSNIFIYKQNITNEILDSLYGITDNLKKSDILIILTKDIESAFIVLPSEIHIEAMIFVKFNKLIDVQVKEVSQYKSNAIGYSDRVMTLGWDIKSNKMVTH
ncbi:MAG: glycosyltransferase family 39 protein [candidate division Zixibacteria bacterium]|nr:glycosyltransferase family 39 protein [candidate division Zixibacteria bacterium]